MKTKVLKIKESKIQIPVILENDEYLVLNKPAGISVHGDGIRSEITVADFILKNYPEISEVGEPMILDKNPKPKSDKEKTELELENEARNFKTKQERFNKRKLSRMNFEEGAAKVNSLENTQDELPSLGEGAQSAEGVGALGIVDSEKIIEIKRPGIVHRLDKDTSGVLIIAKNKRSFAHLKSLFQEHLVKKEYIALVYGWPKVSTGIIDLPIARSKSDFRRKEIAISAKGGDKHRGDERDAMTRYKVLENLTVDNEKLSLIKYYPSTGRMHQIRLHTKSIGHPIVGDHLYGPAKKDLESLLFGKYPARQLLHAKAISFEDIKIESELSADFEAALQYCKNL